MSETTPIKQTSFACPKCKHLLRSVDNALYCSECNRTYPITGGILDFLSGDSQASLAPVFGGTSGITTLERMAKRMDFVAPIYESRLFGSVLLKLSGIGGGCSRLTSRIARFHSKTLEGITGSVLDVACGPATYGRRIASPSRNVYGIDISMGMLRQGKVHVERDNVLGVHLARARVEELPFENAVFDGVICSGSLHLFPDTVLSLREIARTMKPGASLSVQTFIAGKTMINRFVQKHSWVHTFELVELQQYLTEAGFEEFRPELDGIVLTFSARKAMSRT
ncbi:MAG: methyltransferase domain-containing protein [Candidatus Bathyarchaeia archaeon]